MSGEALKDSRLGKNKQHGPSGLLRQSIYSRLAGYEDVKDAERLCVDPAMWYVVGGNLTWRSKRVVRFYNGRGTAEQWIKEGKKAVKWTKLSCRTGAGCFFTREVLRDACYRGNALVGGASQDVTNCSLHPCGNVILQPGT